MKDPKDIPCPPDVLRDAMVWLADELCSMPVGMMRLHLQAERLSPAQHQAIQEHADARRLSVAEPEPGQLFIFPGPGLWEWWANERTGMGGVPVYLGDYLLEMPNGIPLRLTIPEDAVLSALVYKRACTKKELETSSSNPDAVAILKEMRTKYGLEAFIRLPGGRSSGGYGTNIRQGEKTS